MNKQDTIKNHPFNENCFKLNLSKDLVMSWGSWEILVTSDLTWGLKLKTSVMYALLKLHWISERTHSKTSYWLLWIEILFLEHERGHDVSILFHYKKIHLQKLSLKKFICETHCFSLWLMEMSRRGDTKWDWKSDSLNCEYSFEVS